MQGLLGFVCRISIGVSYLMWSEQGSMEPPSGTHVDEIIVIALFEVVQH